MLFFFKNICVYQKNVVPLHPLLTKSRESVAQQVEHIPFKDGVLGSSPSWFTESSSLAALFCFLCSNSSLHYITIFTIRPGTTITFFGA